MSQQSPIDVAKTWVLAFNTKNWDALDAASASDIVYDEVGTQRVIHGRFVIMVLISRASVPRAARALRPNRPSNLSDSGRRPT